VCCPFGTVGVLVAGNPDAAAPVPRSDPVAMAFRHFPQFDVLLLGLPHQQVEGVVGGDAVPYGRASHR
jgi:hypothetical protein